MMFYYYDYNGVQQLYKDLQECIRDAKKDSTAHKVRDTLGGEYWF
jgi:cation transport regulator ChaB